LKQEEELIELEKRDQHLEDSLIAEKEEQVKQEKAAAAAAAGEMDAATGAAFGTDVLDAAAAEMVSDADNNQEKEVAAVSTTAPAKEAAKAKAESVSLASVSLEEVESVVAGRRAKRAAKLSRLLAALSGISSLTVERTELMLLVRKELDVYGRRLQQVGPARWREERVLSHI
jgi:hypothetical protein